MPPIAHLRILGPLEIEGESGVVDVPGLATAQLLLAVLAFQDRPHSRRELIEILWPHDDWDAVWESRPDDLERDSLLRRRQESARKNLDTTASHARGALKAAGIGHLLKAHKGHSLRLRRGPEVEIDIDSARSLLSSSRPDDLRAGLRIQRGHLLQGFESEWLSSAREWQWARVRDAIARLRPQSDADALDAATAALLSRGELAGLDAAIEDVPAPTERHRASVEVRQVGVPAPHGPVGAEVTPPAADELGIPVQGFRDATALQYQIRSVASVADQMTLVGLPPMVLRHLLADQGAQLPLETMLVIDDARDSVAAVEAIRGNPVVALRCSRSVPPIQLCLLDRHLYAWPSSSSHGVACVRYTTGTAQFRLLRDLIRRVVADSEPLEDTGLA